MGQTYNIKIGMSGVKAAVSGINEIRTAESRQRQILKDIADTRSKINRLQKTGADTKLARRKLEFLKAESRELDKQIGRLRTRDRLSGMLRRAAAPMLAAFGAREVFTRARGAMTEAGAMERQAGTIGVGTEFLQEVKFAASQFSIGGDQAAQALQRFTRRLAEAQQGKGELLPTLQEMGIALTDVNGKARTNEAVMEDFADALQKMAGGERLAAAFKAFDSEGAAMLNILKNGAEGFKALREQAHEANAVIDEETIATLAAADAAIERFNQSIGTDFSQIVAGALPFISAFIGGIGLIGDALGATYKFIKNSTAAFLRFVQNTGRGILENPLNFLEIVKSEAKDFGKALADEASIAGQRLALDVQKRAQEARGRITPTEKAETDATAVDQQVKREVEKQAAATATAKLASDALTQIGGFRGGVSSAQARRMDDINMNTRESKKLLDQINRNTKALR